jgi:hypothetical protein
MEAVDFSETLRRNPHPHGLLTTTESVSDLRIFKTVCIFDGVSSLSTSGEQI